MALLGENIDDPRTMGLLALAGGMIRGDTGGGLLGYGQAVQSAQDSALKRQDILQQIQLRNLQLQQGQALFKMQQDAYNGVGQDQPQGGGQPAIPPSQGGALGSGTYGIPTGGQPGMQAGPQGNVAGQLARLERMAIAGVPGAKESLEIFKYKNDPQKVEAGSYSRNPVTGVMTFNVDPKVGLGFDGQGAIVRAPGSQNIAALASESATATEGAKDQFAPPSMVNTPQGPRLMTPAQARLYANGSQGQRPPVVPSVPSAQPADPFANMPPAQPGMSGNFSGNPSDVIRAIANMPDPQERANAYSAFAAQLGSGNGSLPAAGNMPGGALKTSAQEARDAANKAFLEGRAKDANAYESSLNGRVAQGTELNMRLQEQLAALSKFRAGGGAETRATLAQLAQGVPGMPASVVSGIAGGDLASMQEFNKLAAQTAMEQLKQSMGGAGRISQYEFKVFQNNNPNLSTDPEAIRKIFDFNNRLYRRDLGEQQAFNAHIQGGGNPGDFPAQWQQTLARQGVTDPNMQAQSKTVNELPKSGKVGDRARDTQSGQVLRFNGLQWVPEK